MEELKEVNTSRGIVQVRRLALVDYADFIRALNKLPGKIGGFIEGKDEEELKNMNLQDFMPFLAPIIAESWDEVINILAIGTDKDPGFVAGLDLGDAIEILAALLELNDWRKVFNAVKKVMALKPKAQTSTEQAQPAVNQSAQDSAPQPTK